MLSLRCHTISLSLSCLLLIIITITTSASAFASSGGGTVSSTITGGSLTETNSAPIINDATLDGLDQTLTITMPIAISDTTGSGDGWNVTITSTTFTGASHALAANASTISGAAITPGTGTAPVASTVTPVVYAGLVLPGASATAVRFFSAQANSGMGSSIITPTVHIAIPADALADTYVSTITVASVSAP